MVQTTEQHLETVIRAADDRLGQNIMALDVQGITPIADYFVIMDAKNERQLDAVVQAILDACAEADIPVKSIEGQQGGRWVLIDLYDIVVHVFHFTERAHYNIEKNWQDAPLVDIHEWLT
ncbi:ribosome silencing factor [Suicoccus acidiformans]|uniref:Ribosomal silencing factor RsfS n=1 Tax=Suicoccus acidiformans TaxID=2036206 RepID=A0A347WJ99_9LACT|nr:ribosome silencing factor [Suicoccus acidiformans]AXY25156.1 ribosome silencing factor [Suicoccus acidiformans]